MTTTLSDMIEQACATRNLTLWLITPRNILDFRHSDLLGSIGISYKIADRAVYDLRFEPIRRFAKENHLRRINPLELSHLAEDKATMHLELI